MPKELEKRKVLPPAHVKKKQAETPYAAYKKEINRLLSKSQTGGGWSIIFTCKKDIGDSAATSQWHIMDRWVVFAFNTKDEPTIADAKLSAKHEFGHFITGRLERLASYRFTTEDEIREEMEAIARIFEKLV